METPLDPTPATASEIDALVRTVIERRQAMPAPRATYRLQFNRTFTFNDARAIVPYLADLGISHLYASPIFRAAPGSMHGYDVVDYGELNPEIGSREEFDALVAALHAHGMQLIVDFVPNHMGIEGGCNPWWQDVVENGPMSRYAEFFDIDWTPLKRELRNKVLLPFLGGQYGEVLERGELKLVLEEGAFRIQYWETPFPLDPRTYPFVLRRAQAALATRVDPEDLDVLELESIITALERLPGPDDEERAEDAVESRYREQVVARHRLAGLCARSAVVREALHRTVNELNGDPADPRSFDPLDQLLNMQPFRLAFWRVAAEEINYRRFFAINTLAAIRQEEPAVFEATHGLLLSLLVEGAVDGVRIDHPDGLWDPAGYFRQLQHAFVREMVRAEMAPGSEEAWAELRDEVDAAIARALDAIASTDRRWPLYVVGEKILEHGEDLPPTWAIAGTVGYEFAQAATGLLVDAEARQLFDRIYTRYTGDRIRFPDLVYEMKHRQMREAFASEVNVLATVLNRISERDRHSRDFTLNNLRVALREVIACFSVYRTYTTCHEAEVTERDRRYIEAAVAQARRRNPTVDASVYDFVEGVLLLHQTDNPRERLDQRCHFAMKLQQLTGPVMAKGLEDTAFYRFNRLVSLNEVGGDPSRFGIGADEFHRQNRARRRGWPQAMLTSSTHDTKRSEDVRARISVLSERPTEWRAALNRWSRLNRKLKQRVEGALAPYRPDEYLLYQTLVGTWPLAGLDRADRAAYVSRLQEYMVKAAREASRFTTWVNPEEAYEAALRGFIAGMLDPRRSRAFLADIEAFVEQKRDGGLVNALAQQILKLTSPGVPDIYQGTELWDDSLVDPDNRRAVDFAWLARMLAEVRDVDAGTLFASRADGRVKLAVTARLLALRAERAEVFAEGEYLPVGAEGQAAGHVVAYLRRAGEVEVLTVVPRLVTKLARAQGRDVADPAIWAGTTLPVPAGRWHDVLSGGLVDAAGPVPLAEVFRTMPASVLVRAQEA